MRNGVLRYFGKARTLGVLLSMLLAFFGTVQFLSIEQTIVHAQEHKFTNAGHSSDYVVERPAKTYDGSLALQIALITNAEDYPSSQVHAPVPPVFTSNVKPLSSYLIYTLTTSSHL